MTTRVSLFEQHPLSNACLDLMDSKIHPRLANDDPLLERYLVEYSSYFLFD